MHFSHLGSKHVNLVYAARLAVNLRSEFTYHMVMEVFGTISVGLLTVDREKCIHVKRIGKEERIVGSRNKSMSRSDVQGNACVLAATASTLA